MAGLVSFSLVATLAASGCRLVGARAEDVADLLRESEEESEGVAGDSVALETA